jgi:hypothetical protein
MHASRTDMSMAATHAPLRSTAAYGGWVEGKPFLMSVGWLAHVSIISHAADGQLARDSSYLSEGECLG